MGRCAISMKTPTCRILNKELGSSFIVVIIARPNPSMSDASLTSSPGFGAIATHPPRLPAELVDAIGQSDPIRGSSSSPLYFFFAFVLFIVSAHTPPFMPPLTRSGADRVMRLATQLLSLDVTLYMAFASEVDARAGSLLSSDRFTPLELADYLFSLLPPKSPNGDRGARRAYLQILAARVISLVVQALDAPATRLVSTSDPTSAPFGRVPPAHGIRDPHMSSTHCGRQGDGDAACKPQVDARWPSRNRRRVSSHTTIGERPQNERVCAWIQTVLLLS